MDSENDDADDEERGESHVVRLGTGNSSPLTDLIEELFSLSKLEL